ncbi:MAG TPA: GNAT family N-acetyltransferase, partial [Thermodesulfobacteriota bacterium]|nr:GNAT family N-acetyltransferase [Thermodesulfobacteriota bacterium]
GLDGELKPHKLLTVPLKLRGIKEGVLMIMGLTDEYKGKRIGTVLLSRVCDAMIGNGYEKVAGTWVLEDNLGSRRIVENLGGKVDLHWEMYSKIPALNE